MKIDYLTFSFLIKSKGKTKFKLNLIFLVFHSFSYSTSMKWKISTKCNAQWIKITKRIITHWHTCFNFGFFTHTYIIVGWESNDIFSGRLMIFIDWGGCFLGHFFTLMICNRGCFKNQNLTRFPLPHRNLRESTWASLQVFKHWLKSNSHV